MCQPRKWWWGLLPLVALWLGSLFLLTPVIESELVHQANAATGVPTSWAKLAVEGRDIIVQGVAPSETSQKRVMLDVLNVEGVRLVDNASRLMPAIKPFTWSATRAASKLTLAGFVEADGTREKVIADARKVQPTLQIIDDMKDARGAPVGSLSMMAVSLAQLAKLQTGTVALSDNQLTIKGTTADQSSATAATAAAKQLPPPLQLASVNISGPTTASTPAAAPAASKAPVLPTERPFVWLGTRDAETITLSGFVPSEAQRAQVVAAAKAMIGSGRVGDQLKVANGLPPSIDFAAATGFALNQLAQLRPGTAKLTDANLVIEGDALDAAAYRAVTASTTGALPGGLRLDRATINPPRIANYTWAAKREARQLTLTGSYPDEVTRQTMLAAVKQRFADLTLLDRTTIGSGAPAGFAPAMAMGLDQLSRLNSGEASIAAGRFTLTGVAPTETAVKEAQDALAKLVGGMPAEARITFAAISAPTPAPAPVPAAPSPSAPVPAAVAATPTPPLVIPPKPAPEVVAACTADLAKSVASGRIFFESSKAVVLPASMPVIEQIADVMKRCPAMKVEIAGHTDSTGSAELNQVLSKDRAQAILELLVKTGLSVERAKAVGYGTAKPIADNESPEGKAKNRRIEFNVVE